MDAKMKRHWRTRPDYEHRFTYNGFLNCGVCGNFIYSNYQRDDYYVCKGRRVAHSCETKYMRKDILERQLDELFADRLTDVSFLRELAKGFDDQSNNCDSEKKIARLQAQIIGLQAKRQRVLDAFFEGVINASERDMRLGKIDGDLNTAQDLLFREKPAIAVTADILAELFMPFFEWKFLGREDKRRVLSTIVPDIRVADYKVHGLYLMPPSSCRNEVTHTGKDSSQPQA
jgi:Recombinase zinc beta ribbon domain